ncbi:hypothetical protein NST72_20950 [Bacillus sp. FSL W7-1282]
MFKKISNLTDQSTIEEILEDTSAKLQKITQTNKQLDTEQNYVNDVKQNNKYDFGKKPVTNNIDSTYTTIDNLLYAYKMGKITREEFLSALQQQNKPENVNEIYCDIFNRIDGEIINSIEDVRVLKCHYLAKAFEKIIKDFSKQWFVSKDELNLSAIQYVEKVNEIPNIGRIIDSKDYEKYKAIHPDINPFKYSQAIKHDWHKELDEKVVWLNDEMKSVTETSSNRLYELHDDT